MRRLTRWTLYAAAFIVPPAVLGAVRLRELAAVPPVPSLASPVTSVAPAAYDPAKPTVVILLGADVTEITDALGPYEIFSRAGRFNVYAVAPERRPTLLSGGLAILPHFSLAEIDARLGGRTPALVVVPQIPFVTSPENRPLLGWMRRQAAAGSTMFSWCTGAHVLAEAGLLDGLTATAHWGDLAAMERDYPRVRWVRGVRWVDHGKIVTSAGITSGIDASLRVLGRTVGDSVARRVARELRYPNYRFAVDPAMTQYELRPADAVFLANAAFRVARPRIGVALYDGVEELEIGTLYDAHASSQAADVRAVAAAPGIVRSAHGLLLLPALAPSTAPGDSGTAGLRRLDRLVVLGRAGRERAARVVAAVAAAAPSLHPTYLHADGPDRFSYEPVLEDLARTADAPTARFAMKRLEYRSASVRLDGSAVPWSALVLPLALSATGVLLTLVVVRRSAGRRIGMAAALLVLAVPSPARSQTLVAPVLTTRIRVDLLPTDSTRPRWVTRLRGAQHQSIIGTFAGQRGDTVLLAVRAGVDPLRIPQSAVRTLYTSRGRPPRWESAVRSAVLPALVAAVGNGLVASIRRREGDPTPARAALSGAATSAALAGAMGALFPAERWRRASLPEPPAGVTLAAIE